MPQLRHHVNEVAEMAEGFSGRIADLADDAGGVAALARKLGIPRSTLDDYANGRREPKLSQLIEVARSAGLRLEWLATGEGPMRETAPDGAGKMSQLESFATDGKPTKHNGISIGSTETNKWDVDVPLPGPNWDTASAPGSAGLESTQGASAAPPPLDHGLMGLINEGLSRLYRELNARIGPRELGELLAELYDDIVSATNDPEERRTMVKLAISQHRKALRTAGATTAQGKQSA